MKLVTWNTQWCKGLDGVVSVQRIIDGAHAMGDFDVLCLQEIAQHYPALTAGTAADQPAEIARLLPEFEVVFGAAIDEQPANNPTRQRFGNLIASRLPILQVQHLYLPSPVQAVKPHSWMPRQCTVCTVQAAWGPVRVMTTHLEYHSEAQRLAQAQSLRQWHQIFCDQHNHPPDVAPDEANTPYQSKPSTHDVVLCGDFNFEVGSQGHEALTNSVAPHPLRDSWTAAYPNKPHPPTFRLYDNRYGSDAVSCDFCFLSDSLTTRLKHVAVDTSTQVSDHQPVIIELG